MCLQVNLDAESVLANSDAARWHTSPLVKQGIASDRYLPGLQNHACKRVYVFEINFTLQHLRKYLRQISESSSRGGSKCLTYLV